MKRLFLSIILIPILSLAMNSYANNSLPLYFHNNSYSVHIGSSYFHSLVSINIEHYGHAGPHHWGIGYGISAGAGFYGFSGGVHVLANYWHGRGPNYFEARLGVAPTFFTGGDYETANVFPVPIVLIGYRRQIPRSKNFFFVNVGSVGLGFGFGRTFSRR